MKTAIFVLKHASTPFKISSKRLQIFQRKKLSMYRTPIYIIDHVSFWPPSPRGATKKFEIKCAFLLTQTVLSIMQVAGVRLSTERSWKMESVKAMCTTAAGNVVVRTWTEIQVLDRRGTTYNNICDQHVGPKWITEMIAGKYLADLCHGCGEIRVVDMATRHVYRACSPSRPLSLNAMCSGPGEGSLLVWDEMSQAVIQLQWDESTKKLNDVTRVPLPGYDVWYMCYMPHTDLLILSRDWEVVQAVKLHGAGQPPVWQLQGEVLGKEINPDGVSCDSEGRVYVADGSNSRVLVVNGNTGEVIQELLQDAGLGSVYKVCCLSNPHQLLVDHYPPPDRKPTLSLYNITSL